MSFAACDWNDFSIRAALSESAAVVADDDVLGLDGAVPVVAADGCAEESLKRRTSLTMQLNTAILRRRMIRTICASRIGFCSNRSKLIHDEIKIRKNVPKYQANLIIVQFAVVECH